MKMLDILRIRKERNVTQKAIADMLNITQSFLSNIESGRSPLPDDKRQKILDYFDIENPEEYTIDIPALPNLKNIQKSFIGGNRFNDYSSLSLPEILKEIKDSLTVRPDDTKEIPMIKEMLSEMVSSQRKRIEHLETKVEIAQEKIESLQRDLMASREEIWRLRHILARHGIDFDKT